jgi:RNA polymerase sigma-70 factor, ECF subfamily
MLSAPALSSPALIRWAELLRRLLLPSIEGAWPWWARLWPSGSRFHWLANPGIDILLRDFRLAHAVSTPDEWGARVARPVPPRRPEFDEQALIAAAQRGDLPAFNQLILHYQGLAYNVAYRILSDPDAAADATQDGFIKAYSKLNQYRGGSFKAWVLRIVTNTCYDVLRARKRRPTSSLESEDQDAEHDSKLLDKAERPDDFVIRQELAGIIQAAISQLPPDQRTVLVLCDVEGLDYQEIAEATGIALGTVKSRLSRARARVRDILLSQKELLPPQYRLTDS